MESHFKYCKSHEENRYKMFLICKQNPKGRAYKTTGKIGNQIKILFSDFNLNDVGVPAVVCNACRIKISKACNNEIEKSSVQMPNYPKYIYEIETRSPLIPENVCECALCSEIRYRPKNCFVTKISAKKSKISVKRCAK